jgi:dUTP pyrophosphatase
MLTNDEIIELYGNHPGSSEYDDAFIEEYILCNKCPVNGRDCVKYGTGTCCDGITEAYERIRRYMEETEGITNQSDRGIVKVALDEGAIMPTYAHPGWDAGMDLYAREDAMVYRWGRRAFDTGVHIQIPKGYAGVVTGKSGLDHKHGITCHGLVDAGYTGSVRVNLYNSSEFDYPVMAGDKIAQLVIVPVLTPELLQVGDIDGGERGDAGFGSTGR